MGTVEFTDCISAEGKTPPAKECPRYISKQTDSKVPVILELWGIRGTSSLSSLPSPLWPGVIVPDRVLSLGQIELNCVLLLN